MFITQDNAYYILVVTQYLKKNIYLLIESRSRDY